MTFLVSLAGFRPPARFDRQPWTEAFIQEAARRDGPWTTIDLGSLSPVDDDPAAPQERNFTTTLATLGAGWYRVIFGDEEGSQSVSDVISAAQPGQYPSDLLPPIANDVRNRSARLRSLLPSGSADPYVEPLLRNLVAVSTSLVESITQRALDATLPARFIDLAMQAVTLMSEAAAATSAPSVVGESGAGEASMAGAMLRSQSMGPWAETYVYPAELKTKTGRPMVVADPGLDAILWALMTEDARDEFVGLATGQQVPAAAVASFDYRRVGRRRY